MKLAFFPGKSRSVSSQKLGLCPHCGEMSLFWNRFTLGYECFNPRCGVVVDANEAKRGAGSKAAPAKAAREKPPTDLALRRCPQCHRGELVAQPSASSYECQNRVCRRVFGEEELLAVRRRTLCTASLLLTSIALCAGVAVYAVVLLGEIGLPAAGALTAVSIAAAVWAGSTMRAALKFRLRRTGPARTLIPLAVVTLLACAAAAYSGVDPFASAKGYIVERLAAVPEHSATVSGGAADGPWEAAVLAPAAASPTPTAPPAPTPAPTPTPTRAPSPEPTPQPDPIEVVYQQLVTRYAECGNATIPISRGDFEVLAQGWGIEGAVEYVAGGRWDPSAPLCDE